MSVFALGPDGDLKLVNGRLVKLTGPEETAQKLNNRFLLCRGEWFLDTRVGFPLFQLVLVPAPDLDAIKRVVDVVLRSVEGVKDVLSLALTFDRGARKLTIDWTVKHDSGALITGGMGKPYIVDTAQAAA